MSGALAALDEQARPAGGRAAATRPVANRGEATGG